jgi:hypothetical protein
MSPKQIASFSSTGPTCRTGHQSATPEPHRLGIERPGRPKVKRFDGLRWIFGEVAAYASALMLPHEGEAEDFGLRRELDHVCPEPRRQPRFAQCRLVFPRIAAN